MLADELDYVIGVDPHRDEHVVAIVAASTGAVVTGTAAAANLRGYRALLAAVERQARGRRVWAIEGTGSYGAGLTRFLSERGERVLEVSRTPRTERRLRGKDDSLDAARTARAALAAETLALPRTGERREALRLLLVARRSAVDVRREALTQLRAVIVTAPEPLRQELRGLPVGKLLDRCRRLRQTRAAGTDELATRLVLRSLARRIEAATAEAAQLERELLVHVQALAPKLLDQPGVGPIVAAQLLISWSHRAREHRSAPTATRQQHTCPPELIAAPQRGVYHRRVGLPGEVPQPTLEYRLRGGRSTLRLTARLSLAEANGPVRVLRIQREREAADRFAQRLNSKISSADCIRIVDHGNASSLVAPHRHCEAEREDQSHSVRRAAWTTPRGTRGTS